MVKTVSIGKVKFGDKLPFVLMAGPCVIESRQMAIDHAKELKRITSKLRIPFVFKASYDKANRTSINSFRGPGLVKGLEILQEIKETLNVPVISDVHSVDQIDAAAKVLDIMQIPAFLCRQTDLLVKAGQSKCVVSVKKGQFLSPQEMKPIVQKLESTKNKRILLTERGTTFGYNNLVSDFRGLAIMREHGYPIVFDATHSVQQPGGLGETSGGSSEFVALLARCALAAGCDGVFLETHKNPAKAKSDGPNMVPLRKVEALLKELQAIDRVVKK
ncbi:MAG: 2-dehydro-3-deoxyphosphooctonate aldolase (KDO 8-P synthase) [Candidatus Omnitrophota bacterium]|jgi:2-dehydro-3-deoxyphosphooctonate aldolase (KDO 8-P synthase)